MQVEVIPMLINSDFMEIPLDVLMYLADYKMYGESSFVYQDKSKLYKVYEASNISMNDSKVNGEALDYLLKTQNAGEVLMLIHELGQKEQIRKLSTMSAIANNAAAMTAVLSSNTATAAIANSSTAMTAIANNTTAMTAVLNSNTAIASVVNSSTAMTAIANNTTAMAAVLKNSKIVRMIFKQKYSKIKAFILALNKSKENMQYLYDTITSNSRIFHNRAIVATNNMDVLSSHGNSENSIILCALGGNGASWATSTLLINDEIIQTSNITNPQYVDRNNINAVGVPKATFTGYGSPYTAIVVFDVF